MEEDSQRRISYVSDEPKGSGFSYWAYCIHLLGIYGEFLQDCNLYKTRAGAAEVEAVPHPAVISIKVTEWLYQRLVSEPCNQKKSREET